MLVIDGGSSKRVAILGDQITQLACDNSWSGVIVNGCIRDSAIIQTMDIGVKALGTHPVKSIKTFPGERGVIVNFSGVEFVPGHWLYADEVCVCDFVCGCVWRCVLIYLYSLRCNFYVPVLK